ncbi:SNF5-domain-containing protein [Ascodesmis nigricans]|uniref:SNF5-domain-containing protein n=1 Tax=Ascodesmis nigricans TaxID=341454 RepID=A0A4S2MNS3_9PEZI|nr:SNF5-domain-containing protein [Ascodesmis nigricans]
MSPPQALTTTYPQRLQQFATALLAPSTAVPPTTTDTTSTRRTNRSKRIDYSELDLPDDESDAHTTPHPTTATTTTPQLIPPRPTSPIHHLPGKLAHRPLPPPPPTPTQLTGQASLPTTLIPIRLDLDLAGGRLHDTFLWNLHEMLITPDHFAATMAQDLDLPPHVIPTITAAIRDQIAEYAPVAQIQIPESSGEMRAVCAVTVNLDEVVYADRFEWDLTQTLLPPEQFARAVAAELGLRAEFVPAIAAAVYEWCLRRKKDLYAAESAGLPELDVAAARGEEGGNAGWRYDMEGLGEEWSPRVEVMGRAEIEKREIDREREVRRLRRETARFGSAAEGAFGEGELGRGGRGRVRKRVRSVSPEEGWERRGWFCGWCGVVGTGTWGVGDGPEGQKTLCANCSAMWKDRGLPEWAKGLHVYRR